MHIQLLLDSARRKNVLLLVLQIVFFGAICRYKVIQIFLRIIQLLLKVMYLKGEVKFVNLVIERKAIIVHFLIDKSVNKCIFNVII